MPQSIYDSKASKRPANVSINSDLLDKAKALKINLSQAFEARLADLVLEAERKAWLEANRDAIRAFNDSISERGILSDDERPF